MEKLNFAFYGIIYTDDVKHFHTLANTVFRLSIKIFLQRLREMQTLTNYVTIGYSLNTHAFLFH